MSSVSNLLTPRQVTFSKSPLWTAPEYATMASPDPSGKWVLLIAVDHFQLWRLQRTADQSMGLVFVRDLPIKASWEPRWSRTEPDVLYFLHGNVLQALNVNQQTPVVREAFPEYIRSTADDVGGVSGLGEGDLAEDKDHFAFRGIKQDGSQEVFLYSLTKGRVAGSTFPLPPLTNSLYLLAENYVACGTATGTFLFKDGKPVSDRPIIPGQVPHMDAHQTSLVYCSSNDTQLNANAVAIVDVRDPASRRVLLKLDWHYAFHVCCCKVDAAFVATFAEPRYNLPAQMWRVPFGGAPPEVLFNIPTVFRNYLSQPKPSVRDDGGLVVFSADDGVSINTWMAELEPVRVPLPVRPADPAEGWDEVGSLPYDERTDLVCFNSRAQNITVYRRRK